MWQFNTTTEGSCSVTLRVSDASGEVNQSSVSITVTPPLVISTLTANRTLISTGQQIKFTNYTTGGTGNNVYWYSIECDGAVQNESNGNVWQFNTQTSEDGCLVILHVSDASGEVNQSATRVTVTPVLKFTSFTGVTPISLDQVTTFTNTTSGGTELNVYTYSLASGPEGGMLVNQGGGKFSFTKAGTYTVKLGVSDRSGETNSTTTVIVVNPELALAPLPTPINIDQGQNYTYTAVASEGTTPYHYTWTVASGLTVKSGCTNVTTCTVTGTNIGNRTVSVTVTDASAGTPPENATSTSIVDVHQPLSLKVPISSHSLVDQGQLSVESTSVFGGSPPYQTEWLFESPANLTFDLIPGSVQTSNSIITKYIFTTNAMTPIGKWEFEVNAIDSSSALPEYANAINQEGVTVFPQLTATASSSPQLDNTWQ